MGGKCKHSWNLDKIDGGADFRKNKQMWEGKKVYSFCIKCHARTWLSENELKISTLELCLFERGKELQEWKDRYDRVAKMYNKETRI